MTIRRTIQPVVTVLLACLVACSSDKLTGSELVVDSVSLTVERTTLTVGEATQASAIVHNKDGAPIPQASVTWSSSNTDVATVTPSGLVVAVAVGNTTISASSAGKSGSVSISVGAIPVASLSVSLSSNVALVGQQVSASAIARDAGGHQLLGRALSWQSSNLGVATISSAGTIITLDPGTTTITAASEGVTGTAVLTVNSAVASVGVAIASSSIQVGQTTAATATVKDAGGVALEHAVTWTSSNGSVARIDASGTITGVATGSATITARADNVTGSAEITVTAASGGGATPSQLAVITQPAGAVVGRQFSTPPVVEIRDANGAVVSGATNVVTATVASGTGSIAAGGQVAAVNGRATFTNLLISDTGSHRLTFSASGLASATSSTFTIAPALSTTQAVASITITVNSLLAATVPVVATGGLPPYTYTLSGGTLPAGLTFSGSTGRLTGTPTAVLTTKTFTVTATDETGTTSSKTFQLTVNPLPSPLSTTQSVASVSGTVGTALSVTPIVATGGVTPYAYSLSGGTLPAGLSLNTANGLLSGIPSTALSATVFTVTVTDAAAATSSKTFTLTVAQGSGTVTAECDTPKTGWIFCDDFETSRLSSYFEYDNANGKFVRTPSTGFNGSIGMRATYTTGQPGAGSLHLAFGRTPSTYFKPADAGTQNYREIYWRFYLLREAGWVGNGADKITRAMIFAKSDWSQAMIAHGWTNSADRRYLLLDPASGTDDAGNVVTVGYNDFDHLRWLGAVSSAAPEEDQAHVGQWACYEFHLKLNDAGQTNGLFELQVNGQLSARKTGLNFVSSYSAYGINAMYLEQYQNDGAPAANVRVIDNLVVSTQPIGCLSK